MIYMNMKSEQSMWERSMQFVVGDGGGGDLARPNI